MKGGITLKKLLVVLIWGAFLVPGLNLSAETVNSPKPLKLEKKSVVVRGNVAWANTGIKLKPTDKVTVTATGSVCFNNESESCVGPQGWPVNAYAQAWPENWNYCDDALKSDNHAALIGEVGSNRFIIGNRQTFSGKDGVLYLGINDCTVSGEYGNTGEFTVVIQVKR